MFSLVPWKKNKAQTGIFFAPFREMEEMFNRAFSDFFDATVTEKIGLPAFNMYKDKGNLIVEASLPGYDKNNITVELEGDLLTIKGEQKEEKEEKEKDYYHREFHAGSFTRTVKLPGKVNPDDLKAKYENGVLKVILPSAEPAEKVKVIKIE